MAITVNLYSFTKRENSTKQPTGSGTAFSCTMIDNTSLMNPTFKLSIVTNPIGMNYAYVPDFNRYYFITDISTYQNFWYISCTCDVLASFKTAIGSGSHYVLRAASEYDGNICDTIYPAKINATEEMIAPTTNFLNWSNGHSFVLGIIGEADLAAKQFGSIVYYHMDDAALLQFLHDLMGNVSSWSDISTTEYDNGVQQALLNPMQYIISCICLPVPPPDNNTDPRPSKIKFGYYEWSTGGVGNIHVLLTSNPTYFETTKIDIPTHPQAATRGNYLNCQPYSEYILHFDPVGDIPLDPTLCQENDMANVIMELDMTNGQASLVVQGDTYLQDIFFNGSCQVGVNINISQVYVDLQAQERVQIEALTTMGEAAWTPAPSGLFRIIGAAATGINDATRLNFPTVTGIPNGGAFLPYFHTFNFYLLRKYLPIVDENLAEIGRPLCKTKQINTLSGFILCSGADCQISGTQEEARKINDYMNTGFFYE